MQVSTEWKESVDGAVDFIMSECIHPLDKLTKDEVSKIKSVISLEIMELAEFLWEADRC